MDIAFENIKDTSNSLLNVFKNKFDKDDTNCKDENNNEVDNISLMLINEIKLSILKTNNLLSFLEIHEFENKSLKYSQKSEFINKYTKLEHMINYLKINFNVINFCDTQTNLVEIKEAILYFDEYCNLPCIIKLKNIIFEIELNSFNIISNIFIRGGSITQNNENYVQKIYDEIDFNLVTKSLGTIYINNLINIFVDLQLILFQKYIKENYFLLDNYVSLKELIIYSCGWILLLIDKINNIYGIYFSDWIIIDVLFYKFKIQLCLHISNMLTPITTSSSQNSQFMLNINFLKSNIKENIKENKINIDDDNIIILSIINIVREFEEKINKLLITKILFEDSIVNLFDDRINFIIDKEKIIFIELNQTTQIINSPEQLYNYIKESAHRTKFYSTGKIFVVMSKIYAQEIELCANNFIKIYDMEREKELEFHQKMEDKLFEILILCDNCLNYISKLECYIKKYIQSKYSVEINYTDTVNVVYDIINYLYKKLVIETIKRMKFEILSNCKKDINTIDNWIDKSTNKFVNTISRANHANLTQLYINMFFEKFVKEFFNQLCTSIWCLGPINSDFGEILYSKFLEIKDKLNPINKSPNSTIYNKHNKIIDIDSHQTEILLKALMLHKDNLYSEDIHKQFFPDGKLSYDKIMILKGSLNLLHRSASTIETVSSSSKNTMSKGAHGITKNISDVTLGVKEFLNGKLLFDDQAQHNKNNNEKEIKNFNFMKIFKK